MAGRGDGERVGGIGEGGKVMGGVLLGIAIGFLLSGICWMAWYLAPLGTCRGDYIGLPGYQPLADTPISQPPGEE